MRTEKLSTEAVQTVITIGHKQYVVKLDELTQFLINCQNRLGVTSAQGIEGQISRITELVLDGANDELRAENFLTPLRFLRELDFLFKGLIYEISDDRNR